ncbi:MAG TPA: hypothetical protein VMW35_15010 [Myxococcota bacterium]|nr:hypothetical protein [Myxococcota bacterium]
MPKEGNAVPPEAPRKGLLGGDRITSFRSTYVAFFLFVILYVFSVKALEHALYVHFERRLADAVAVDPSGGPVPTQIQQRIDGVLRDSPWIRLGGVKVTVLAFARDGRTPLYVDGRTPPPSPEFTDPWEWLREAERLLPARIDLTVSVPHNAPAANALLVLYAAVLLTVLFAFQRAIARREGERLDAALAARETMAARAAQIERELEAVRSRLDEVEPADELHREEIHSLQQERAALAQKLQGLEARERELRAQAVKATELDAERRTLEELLDEAVRDVSKRDDEIAQLEQRLKRAAKESPSGARAREGEHLARRLRTLYKNLEIDDRAIDDLVALRDLEMQLKAEEALKRLSDEPDTAAVRRKVGGLPPQLSIFELGFAGKGRIYYQKGDVRRFRILTVGAKNSQKQDLEYLSRLG